jgi:hypothetical protein
MRVCKIAAHELGHMFCMGHCAWYECLMKGTNHLEQTDRHPCYFCPICYRKLHKCIKFDHVKRYKDLTACCESFGGQFTKPQKYERDNGSYKDWFEKRYKDLKKFESQAPKREEAKEESKSNSLALPPAAPRQRRASANLAVE